MPSMCSGPCLPHCYRCNAVTATLAYVALAYLIASIVYVAATRSMGTPFGDSLTDQQRAIKEASKGARRSAFCTGLVVAAAVLAVVRPLGK